MALELREVEVRPGASLEQALGVAVKVDAEVEEPRGHVLAVDFDVPLLQMPAARADEQDGDLVVQRVALLALLQRDGPVDGVGKVLLAPEDVLPGRRVRVLEVRHVHACTGVEGIDDHLPVARRPRDLDAAVLEIGGHRRHAPVATANCMRRLEEARELACDNSLLTVCSCEQELFSTVAELPLERDDEIERIGCEDARFVGCGDGCGGDGGQNAIPPPRTGPPRSSL